jgi:hypothetical protein
MSLQKSLVQPFRRNMLLVGAGWRAFYAPYNITIGSNQANTSLGPAILDLQQGPFTDAKLVQSTGAYTNAPVFFDLGWIKDFAITVESKVGNVRSGYRGAVRSKYRGQVGEKIAFKFRESGRMQTKIATGTDVFNLLHSATGATGGPVSGGGVTDPTTVAMVSYTASTASLVVAAGSGSLFSANDLIVVDKDYNGTDFGLVGENATPIFQGQVTDTDYIRKTSDFVARVKSVSVDTLTLSSPLIGGGSGDPTGNLGPQAGSKVQKLSGFASREGGTYITEWTALFLMDCIDGAQIAVYYPHLAIDTFRGYGAWTIEDQGTTDQTGYELDCSQEAMAFDDPIDGQTVIGYRAYFPAPKGSDIGY